MFIAAQIAEIKLPLCQNASEWQSLSLFGLLESVLKHLQ